MHNADNAYYSAVARRIPDAAAFIGRRACGRDSKISDNFMICDNCAFAAALGHTPLVRLRRISSVIGANLFVKLERANPAGSIKDRVAWRMIKDAADRGILVPGSGEVGIIEPTSGNAGIGLAAVGAALGIPVTIVMPETAKPEQRKRISLYNARIILTPAAEGMKGAIRRARAHADKSPHKYFMPMQFENPANVWAHRDTTGPEILEGIRAAGAAKADIFVAGVGTGGTLAGVSQCLRRHNPDLLSYAVEPAESPVLFQTLRNAPITPGPHGIQGIGAGFVPKLLDLSLICDAVGIRTQTAADVAKDVLRHDGLSAGISGGANIAAVVELFRRGCLRPGQNIVTVIPDGAEKYLCAGLAD